MPIALSECMWSELLSLNIAAWHVVGGASDDNFFNHIPQSWSVAQNTVNSSRGYSSTRAHKNGQLE